MRLSTSMLYELGMAGINRQNLDALELQEKISAGRRVVKPSDDPIASAAVLGINEAAALNEQYSTNAANARAMLALEEQALADATRVLQDVKELTVKAGNPGMQNSDRQSMAAQLRGLYDELIGIANRTDGRGQFIFSGFQGTTQPFAESSPGSVSYSGDQGQRLIQIGAQRRVAAGDSGDEIFQRMRAGNGTFIRDPGATNSGNALAGPGSVRNAQAWNNPANSRDYTVVFHVQGNVTTYDIVDNVNNVSMLTGAAPAAGPHARTYTPGVAIQFSRQAGDPSGAAWDAGVQLDVSGTPATADTFRIQRAPVQDVFRTVHDLVDTLNTGFSPLSAASGAQFQNELNATGASVDRAIDSILTARASVGSRLREIETAQSAQADLALHYEEDKSRLVDLDYAQALSDVSRKQFSLEAAQKSYVAITRLKLFDFIR